MHEAVYNKNSFITLLSEYQLREHGIVIKSVAKKHLSTGGTYGTHTLYASEGKECPLIDKGGLMGIQVYSIEDGDEAKYDIIDVTSTKTWCLKPHNVICEVTSFLNNRSLDDVKSMA